MFEIQKKQNPNCDDDAFSAPAVYDADYAKGPV